MKTAIALVLLAAVLIMIWREAAYRAVVWFFWPWMRADTTTTPPADTPDPPV